MFRRTACPYEVEPKGMGAMEISLFETDKPLAIERCVLYPYPDLKRIWTRLWLTAVQEENHPNLEVAVYNADGSENCSVYMMEHAELRAETTLHLRNPMPGSTYHVVVEMTQGLGEGAKLLDRHVIGCPWDWVAQVQRRLGPQLGMLHHVDAAILAAIGVQDHDLQVGMVLLLHRGQPQPRPDAFEVGIRIEHTAFDRQRLVVFK